MSCYRLVGQIDQAGSGPAAGGEETVRSQIAVRTRCRALTTAVLAVAATLAITSFARSQEEVVLLVNGEPITSLDIQQRAKFMEMSSHKAPTRQEAIDSLIDQILELREARRYTIVPTDTDVNNAFANVASHMGVDSQKLSQILANGGASADTLKLQLRAQIAWTSLVRGRYKASLVIPDTDVEAELQLHDANQKNDVGYEYIMRPIILVVPHGSPDAAYESRKRDAEALRGRFISCTDGVAFAQGLPEVAVRDAVYKSSADLPQQLRDILDGTEVGHLTPPEQTDEGIQMFAVCSKKESKTDTPEARKLRDEMFDRKFGARAKRYLADLRRQAMIEYK
jgi:peptidyl-prolyl cis-trans isomerase SurA